MPEPRTGYAVGPTVLYGFGIVLTVIVIVKASIIGYYDSDIVWMLPTALVAAASCWIARKWSERL